MSDINYSNQQSEVEILTPKAQDNLAIWSEQQALEARRLEQLEGLAKLMDAQFNIPFSPIPIGLDSIVGLIPGIGDTISLAVSGSIVLGAKKLGVGSRHLGRMGFNIFIDWLIGLVPIIGDLFDVGWRGNIRNVKILREALEARWQVERDDIVKGNS